MLLHYRKIGEGPVLAILHGLFGSSDNWQTLAKKYAENHTVLLVDQRNHGHSFHSDEFSYDLMAQDLKSVLDFENINSASFIGHSMGGKSVMTFAQQFPEMVEKLIVADMGVKGYPPHHDVILEALNSIDLNVLKSRKEVEDQLSTYIHNIGVKQFLLKNLYWESEGQLGWRINIPVLTRKMPTIIGAMPRIKCDANTLFVSGGQSNYVVKSDYEDILSTFPNATFEVIEPAGHWLHAEAPQAFYDITTRFLEND